MSTSFNTSCFRIYKMRWNYAGKACCLHMFFMSLLLPVAARWYPVAGR